MLLLAVFAEPLSVVLGVFCRDLAVIGLDRSTVDTIGPCEQHDGASQGPS